MDIIFLDFQESFDSVLPKRLMLKERGVKGQEKSLLIKLKSGSKQEQWGARSVIFTDGGEIEFVRLQHFCVSS